jgi:hypothetical protein
MDRVDDERVDDEERVEVMHLKNIDRTEMMKKLYLNWNIYQVMDNKVLKYCQCMSGLESII